MTYSVKDARNLCEKYHKGQYRLSGVKFYNHPVEVAALLEEHGYNDKFTQCLGFLHDVIEDTEIDPGKIRLIFGDDLLEGLYTLSRNIGPGERKIPNEKYKEGISLAEPRVQRVKIADVAVNVPTLGFLGARKIEMTLNDAETFYIPLGRKIAYDMTQVLVRNVKGFREKQKSGNLIELRPTS